MAYRNSNLVAQADIPLRGAGRFGAPNPQNEDPVLRAEFDAVIERLMTEITDNLTLSDHGWRTDSWTSRGSLHGVMLRITGTSKGRKVTYYVEADPDVVGAHRPSAKEGETRVTKRGIDSGGPTYLRNLVNGYAVRSSSADKAKRILSDLAMQSRDILIALHGRPDGVRRVFERVATALDRLAFVDDLVYSIVNKASGIMPSEKVLSPRWMPAVEAVAVQMARAMRAAIDTLGLPTTVEMSYHDCIPRSIEEPMDYRQAYRARHATIGLLGSGHTHGATAAQTGNRIALSWSRPGIEPSDAVEHLQDDVIRESEPWGEEPGCIEALASSTHWLSVAGIGELGVSINDHFAVRQANDDHGNAFVAITYDGMTVARVEVHPEDGRRIMLVTPLAEALGLTDETKALINRLRGMSAADLLADATKVLGYCPVAHRALTSAESAVGISVDAGLLLGMQASMTANIEAASGDVEFVTLDAGGTPLLVPTDDTEALALLAVLGIRS